MTKLTGILIAAGQSRRFGGDKLLHPMCDGTPLALMALRNLRPVCSEVAAVLRPDQEKLACLLWNEGARIVVSEDSSAGMGHSLAAGVRACADAQGWLLALADMPYVQTATMQRVADAVVAGASIAAPVHEAQRGHPVGFSRKWYAQLAGLSGDSGARQLLQAYANEVTLIACTDGGIHRDIDTPADLLSA
ncbi:MAG TPA: nucleotidyltransferase family protein [Rhodocyclaceae bacterium]